jgi:protein-arginine kinase activator protein McsA
MKQILLSSCLIISFGLNGIAQDNSTITINELDSLLNEPVKASEYEKAAALKKQKQLLVQLDSAVNSEDFEKAAALQKELTII